MLYIVIIVIYYYFLFDAADGCGCWSPCIPFPTLASPDRSALLIRFKAASACLSRSRHKNCGKNELYELLNTVLYLLSYLVLQVFCVLSSSCLLLVFLSLLESSCLVDPSTDFWPTQLGLTALCIHSPQYKCFMLERFGFKLPVYSLVMSGAQLMHLSMLYLLAFSAYSRS